MIQSNHPAIKVFRIIFVGLLALLAELQRPAAAQPPKLNVLLIMADDLRDFGGAFSREVVKMPHLDRLRACGVTIERSCRAPLVIAAPGVKGGQTTHSLVEFVDLYPTVADFCGLQRTPGAAGTTLRPILNNPAVSVKDAAFTLVTRGAKLYGQSVRTTRWRLTRWSDGQRELYDHDHDPEESHNVAEANPAVVAQLEARLKTLPPFKPTRSNRKLAINPRASANGITMITKALRFAAWPALLLAGSGLAATAAAAPAQPNILFIFSDDHAQHAISAYGSKVNQTPSIDRLAREGARFQHSFVANSICTPSRATLLTGQHSHLSGVPVFNRFDGSRDHVAKRLQAGGYYTGMIGKWHLGSDPTGFNRWIVLPGQGEYWNPTFLVPGHKLTISGHCTEITTDLGLEFLKTRPQDKPFFLMLHHKAPHRSWEPDPRNQALFQDKVIPEPATLWDDYATRPAALPANQQTVARDLTRRDLKLAPPADLQGAALKQWLNVKPMELTVDGKTLTGKELVQWKYQRYLRDYLACVQGVDDSVGEVLDYLDQTDLATNTIVIYSADNGWYLGDLGLYDKRFMYEPGLNVPLLARGPGIKAGIVPSQFVANIDLAPTFLDLAGLPLPAWMQGRSLVPVLRGESPAGWRTSFYYRYYHDPGHHNTAAHLGVRTATHKLIYYWKKSTYEMFDLTADPREQHNLLFSEAEASQPVVAAKFAELKAEIARLQKEYQDDGQYADPGTWPKTSADKPFDAYKPLGIQTISQAIRAATVK